MFFLFAYNRSAGHNAAADKQQCDPQHKIAVVAGRGRLRKLRRYSAGLGDFLSAVFVTVILITAAAVPILDIALGVLGCRLCGNMFEVGVGIRVEFAVSLSAELAYRLFGASRRAAGAVFGFGAGAAVCRALAGVCAVTS